MRAARLLACSFFAFALTHVAVASGDPVQQRAIDPAKSKAQFSIQHIFVQQVTGTIPIVSGELTTAAGSRVPSRIAAVLDASKIDTGDPDRDGTLEGPDYFETQKFATWTFSGSKITPSGPAAFGVDGMLTIHGVTQPEHLDVTVSGDPSNPLYRATAQVDRRAFGMKGSRLDPVIGNVANVTLDIVLK
jgi:polyisoprenoid-binding protein YceI